MSNLIAVLWAGALSCAALPVLAQQAAPATADPAVAVALAAAAPQFASLTPQQVDNVVALGQVWGLLKYFHPAVAGGQRDWDAEFLRQLPAVLACQSAGPRSQLLSAWVTGLGVVPALASPPPPTKPVRLTTDLRWAQDKRRFSAPLRQQLAFIAANHYLGVPFYVSFADAGNPTFPHEAPYADQACPAAGLRLLALCRHWNIVQYYYPYRYAIGQEWTTVLADLLPRFAAATTPLAYRHAALRLAACLHDGHATLRDPLLETEQGNYLVAAAMQFIDNKATVIRVRRDGQVPQPPLEPGDIITHVAGRPVADLVQQQLPETPGSNQAAQLRTIALNLLYASNPQLDLQVLRAGQSLHLTAPCFKIGTAPPMRPALADSMYRFVTPEVGYIDMARITKAKLPMLMQAFAHTKGIVVDSRNYPGEFVTRSLPGYFLARPMPFATYAVCDTLQPGRFLQLPADTLWPAGPAPYTGQLVVLVNESTLSQAEYTGMALQATPHGTLLGSSTAAADGNVSRIILPGGLKTAMSGIGIYYPNGRETQRVGLVIDVPVRPTVAGLRAGRDELLDEAIKLITNDKTPKPHG